MRYLKLVWHHDSTDDPQVIWTEINDNNIEIRKIEYYEDGRLGLAGAGRSDGSTELGLWAVPPIEEIKRSPEFSPTEISPAEFESEWRHAVSQKERRPGSVRRPRGRGTRSKIRVRSTTGSLSRFLEISATTTEWEIRTNRGKKVAAASTREKAVKLAQEILLSTKKKSSSGSRIQDPSKVPTRNTERQPKK
ncbi:DUF6881 domain-containing protein [Streptomyces sp. NPDC098789]|uniref:DUF6881 domain-containing protein n=1 Tax=Streptomyces sp. NPDC098789 TaxID=3366098 RepID=UPI0037F5EE03